MVLRCLIYIASFEYTRYCSRHIKREKIWIWFCINAKMFQNRISKILYMEPLFNTSTNRNISIEWFISKWKFRAKAQRGYTRHHMLTHWSRVTHICVGKVTIIGSDNGLSPARHQAIIWTNAGILLIGHLRTNFSEILIKIETCSLLMKKHLKVSSAKWRPFCLGHNVLNSLVTISVL